MLDMLRLEGTFVNHPRAFGIIHRILALVKVLKHALTILTKEG